MRKTFTLLLLCTFIIENFAHTFTKSRAFPCPSDNDIVPCICTADTNLELYMDCSNINNEDELTTALTAIFPFYNFKKLTINQEDKPTSQFTTLSRAALGELTFEYVEITSTPLQTIADGTFTRSHQTLIELSLKRNAISLFPFEALANYIELTKLDLSQNELSDLPNIETDSLTYISVANNPLIGSIDDTTFEKALQLKHIDLDNIGLTVVPPNCFNKLQYLEYLTMNANLLTYLDDDVVNTPRTTITEVGFDLNQITTIKANSITGLSPDAIVQMEQNELSELEQTIWEPLFQQVRKTASINLEGNGLTCGCDIAWIIRNPAYVNLITPHTECQGGNYLVDISVSVINSLCPPAVVNRH